MRYRPSAQADLADHSILVGLLEQDLADLPPQILETAIRAHVANSPYMPKASDLIARCKDLLHNETRKTGNQAIDDYCARLNSMVWVQASGKPYRVSTRQGADGQPIRFIDRD